MGRAGYVGKMEQWYKEELANETLINSDGDITKIEDVVSSRLADRGYTWIKAHTPATKNPPSQTQKVIDDIKHWSEMAKKGEFVPTRLEDALAKATGKYDRRTRGVGSHVGLQQYFGKPTSRAPRGNLYTLDELNSFKEEVKRETMDEMKVIMNQQLSEILKACGVQLPREFEVNMRDSPLLSRRRDQSSYHSTELNDPFKELQIPTACRLAVLEFENLITVAEGMVWPWVEGKKVHNTPLSPKNVQVSIDKIIESTAPLPVPWDGFQRVGEVLGSFAQWPKQLVLVGLDEATSIEKVKSKQTKSYTSEIDKSVYNYSEPTTVHLSTRDIRKMFRFKWLNISVLQLWGSYLYQCETTNEDHDVVGFLCPERLPSYMYNSSYEKHTFISDSLSTHRYKKYVMGAFFETDHWMLVVFCLGDAIAYIFDFDQAQKKQLTIRKELES
ncbi:hypothetical protein RND81_08G089100 [Saponaria officinalis]|uniref:DUF8039 domain-containing protein n=1 Tax=Saponaria officinalis TaxID=3572 RepID=A0AAW1J6I6_SAPOF